MNIYTDSDESWLCDKMLLLCSLKPEMTLSVTYRYIALCVTVCQSIRGHASDSVYRIIHYVFHFSLTSVQRSTIILVSNAIADVNINISDFTPAAAIIRYKSMP